MKRKICFVLWVVLLFQLSACSKNSEQKHFEAVSEVGTEQAELKQEETFTLNSGIVGEYPDSTFVYDGAPIKIKYRWDAEGKFQMGLKVYLNGIEQRYSVNGTETNMHVEDMDSNTKEFELEFTPNVGEKGENLEVLFANVFEPKILKISEEGFLKFGHQQSISSPMLWYVRMESDGIKAASNIFEKLPSTKLSEEEKQAYMDKDNFGNTRNHLDVQEIKFFQDDSEISNGIIDSTKPLTIRILGGREGAYRVSVHKNFNVCAIDQKSYFDIVSDKESYTDIVIPKNEFKSGDNVYVMSISVGGDGDWKKCRTLCVR